MASFLEQTYPGLRGNIEGSNYPPPPMAELIGNVLSAVQLFALLWFVMGGEKVLRMLGYRVLPAWYQTIQNHSLQIGLALFLVLPQFLAKWLVTGAFEIYLDGDRVWSKLEKGDFPKMDELISALAAKGLHK